MYRFFHSVVSNITINSCINLVLQESADNVSPDSTSPSKDALLEEACKKYDEATRLCPTLHDVCKRKPFYTFTTHDAVVQNVNRRWGRERKR